MSLEQPANSPAKPRRRPHRNRVRLADVEAALKASRGLLEPAARAVGTTRGSLTNMLKRYARLETVRREQHQVMGDFAESKLFKLIDRDHFPAVSYYLSNLHKDRGYSSTGLGGDMVNNVTIGTVNVVSVPSGTFLPAADGVVIGPAGDAPSVHRGSKTIDHEPDPAA
jgi:hypothetical protein